jgi:hypothetical protein
MSPASARFTNGNRSIFMRCTRCRAHPTFKHYASTMRTRRSQGDIPRGITASTMNSDRRRDGCTMLLPYAPIGAFFRGRLQKLASPEAKIQFLRSIGESHSYPNAALNPTIP